MEAAEFDGFVTQTQHIQYILSSHGTFRSYQFKSMSIVSLGTFGSCPFISILTSLGTFGLCPFISISVHSDHYRYIRIISIQYILSSHGTFRLYQFKSISVLSDHSRYIQIISSEYCPVSVHSVHIQ
ncbi:hypothetical protein DPMN_185786 [Dreissena polymorpha]|uniref:Uncharacterized protein n=1 Tax=Dreissena polymorpha TaxID=45954 RepID=A0A9D4DP93_DREPO|nr:hypothetical protein DPMN_185786 [Dreissena polymorpha]